MKDPFKALADETRRGLLDKLFLQNGQSLSDLSENMGISRQAISKHLYILESANLISTRRRGREKLHFLNPIPIVEIVHRWVGRFEDARLQGLLDLKTQSEIQQENKHAL